MGWVARIVACGTALSVVACAAIAGLDDPQTADLSANGDGDGSVQNTSSSGNPSSSSGGSSGAGSSSGNTSSGNDGSSPDATTDAPIDTGPTCSLFKNGDACQAGSQCCSNKCSEERKCTNDCKSGGSFGCDPTSTSSCCVGSWCSLGQCAGCITTGQPAAKPAGIPYFASCCSRAVDLNGNCQ